MIMTPAQINELNSNLWNTQLILMNERMADPAILEIAVMRIGSESSQGIAVGARKIFEQQLAEAQEARDIVLSQFGAKGGKTLKADALNDLIREIFLENPNITAKELPDVLAGPRGAGVVISIDEPSLLPVGDVPCIHYFNDNGKPKTASILGLKDRLSKIKKQIQDSL